MNKERLTCCVEEKRKHELELNSDLQPPVQFLGSTLKKYISQRLHLSFFFPCLNCNNTLVVMAAITLEAPSGGKRLGGVL